MNRVPKQWWLYPVLAAGLAACNHSGSSSSESSDSVSGLQIASTMSVVTAQDEDSSSHLRGMRSTTARAVQDPLPSGEYASDEQHVYVWDESMDSLSTVNEILCYFGQLKTDEMVNQGAYIALVDENKCRQGQNQSSSGSTGQSSTGTTTSYETWTVLSTRASADAPQIVKVWVPGADSANPEDASTILAQITITEGTSATKPYGSFVLNFKGVIDSGVLQGGAESGTLVEMMNGTLQTVDNADDKPQFKFIMLNGGELLPGQNLAFGSKEAANVILDDASGTSGHARAMRSETGDFDGPGPMGVVTETKNFAVDFNASLMMRAKDTNNDNSPEAQRCLSRTDFNTQVWRYNVYNAATGASVTLNSGFPFTYNGKFGHVGYWGVWYEGGTLPDGTTISQMDFSSDTTTNYTVNVAPGKLVKRTANTLTLAEMAGEEMFYWGSLDNYATFGQYVVVVDTTNAYGFGANKFVATGSVTFGDTGPSSEDLGTPVDVTPASHMMIGLWSDALGGSVNYLGGDSTVTFYAQEFVSPSDSIFGSDSSTQVTLYCYQRCLKGGLTTIAGLTSENDLYYADITNPGDSYAYKAYVSSGKLLVKDHLGNVVDFSALDISSLGHSWGINTNEMVTTAVSNPWEVYGASSSYHWETGSNNWNQMVTVQKVSDGTFATFDKPLHFTYTFATGDNRNPSDATAVAYEGKKFLLQYEGEGQLFGFPWIQDSNNANRWHTAITLKDGVIINDGTRDYIVKAIEMEQSMLLSNTSNSADVSACSNAGLAAGDLFTDSTLTLPTSADIGTVSHTLAQKPDVTDAPAVIGGVLQ
ncbi:MAG: hypothetical protein HY308_05630 [Gammaproteobacteria bacterium]|nr:hypothetical protein [Gammaproteobacteria bacterium]